MKGNYIQKHQRFHVCTHNRDRLPNIKQQLHHQDYLSQQKSAHHQKGNNLRHQLKAKLHENLRNQQKVSPSRNSNILLSATYYRQFHQSGFVHFLAIVFHNFYHNLSQNFKIFKNKHSVRLL